MIEIDLGLDYFLHLELLSQNQINSIREEVMNELEKSGKLDFDLNSNEYNELINESRKKITENSKEELVDDSEIL